jgi:hypothetical protein
MNKRVNLCKFRESSVGLIDTELYKFNYENRIQFFSIEYLNA